MSKGRRHPVIGLWSLTVFDALEEALISQVVRKIDAFTDAVGCHYISYDEGDDPFLNLNRPDDLAAYQALIEG
jgi:molybdopterin-guanine dinucleotide biosynthesis protein A